MRLVKIFILSGFVILSSKIWPQQVFQISQYMTRPSIYNPAASGSSEAICLFAAGRNQWIGYKDEMDNPIGPSNYFGGIEMPVYPINSGVGLMVEKSIVGYQTATNVKLNYSYKAEIADKQTISAGILINLSELSLDFDKLFPYDPNDPLMNITGKQKDLVPDAGFGIFYSNNNKFWAGASVLNILGSKATLGNIELKNNTNFIAQGLYRFHLVEKLNQTIDVAPAFLLKTYVAGTQVDLNLMGYYNDLFWLGTGYRVNDGLILMGGVQFFNINIGLSYDFTTNQEQKATSAGSAEIHLSYCIDASSQKCRSCPSFTKPTPTKKKNNRLFNTRRL